jgi:hypothetical protein
VTDPTAIPVAWFERWWEPEEFFRTVVRYVNALPSPDEVVTEPHYQRVREAYVAGFFAMIRDQHAAVPIRVQLEPDRFPDVNLRIGAVVEPFEIVEVQRPGRRRGDEYRERAAHAVAGRPPRLRLENPLSEQQTAAPALRTA